MQFRYVIAGVLILLIGYGAVKAFPLLRGPEIRVDPILVEPEHGFTTLSGHALHTETLTLDGNTLLIDEQGRFSKVLTLPRGGITITLKAKDRFGRTTSLDKEIIVP
ncbi:MAG: hypothetical protein AB203_04270 [Parcubacteria bacterium C7867-008]|nr:MAG: hypothetical protein AB203_04270 [Parcubacteria bacterium C7867-008]